MWRSKSLPADYYDSMVAKRKPGLIIGKGFHPILSPGLLLPDPFHSDVSSTESSSIRGSSIQQNPDDNEEDQDDSSNAPGTEQFR